MKRETYQGLSSAGKELITFVAVTLVCLGLTIFLGTAGSEMKGVLHYFAQGVLTTLFALPTGAAWRSLRQALKSRK